MSRQQQSVEDVFGGALERPAEQRAAFLDAACAADPALRRLVDDLLAADERAGSFLEEPLLLDFVHLPDLLASATPDTLLTHAGDPAFTQPAPDLARFAPGQRIAGRFTVVRFLARGGMGEVYEVDDQLLQGARVALKAILPHIAADAGASRRFEQEVLLARKVVHPNLCPIYDIARCNDAEPPFLFLTMKLLSGETLAARLRAPHPIPAEDAHRVAHQITCGLAAIHAAGVIHGDIKPNNIMLEGSGSGLSLSIMDFGLARLHTTEHTILTRTLIAGTPGYLAPEILRGERPSQATDLFALGVLLHRVLVGSAPETVFSSLAVHPSADLDAPGIPAFLAEAVRGLLSELPAPRTAAFHTLLARYDPAFHPQTGPAPDSAAAAQVDRRKNRVYTGPERRTLPSPDHLAPSPPGRSPASAARSPSSKERRRPAGQEQDSSAGPPRPFVSSQSHRVSSRQHRAAARPDSPAPRLSRRTFALGSAAAACAAAAGTLVWRPTLLDGLVDDLLHPLPRKRFVALVGWPAPDARLKPMLMSLIDSIGSELARAEAFDRDLYIIPHASAADITTPGQLSAIRESSGANLVLAASAIPAGNDVHLNFQVLDPNTPHPLRSRQITAPADQQASLLTRSLHTAATLLDIRHYAPDPKRLNAGTDNPQALAAFQVAEAIGREHDSNRVESAISKYREAVELDPAYGRAYAQLGLAYCRLYELHHDPAAVALARANAKAAMTHAPDLAQAHLAASAVSYTIGDRKNAVRESEKAVSIDPTDSLALVQHAQMLQACNQWHESELVFRRLLDARPNNRVAHAQVADLYTAIGRYAEALIECRTALIAEPKNADTLSNVASISLQLGRVSDAEVFARKSLAIETNSFALCVLASIYRVQKHFREGIAAASSAIQLEPTNASYWLELGDNHSGASHYQSSRDAFQQMHRVQTDLLLDNPFDGPGWVLSALASGKLGKTSECLADLAKAAENYAGDLDSQLLRVRALELAGARAEALSTIRWCVSRGATRFQLQTMPDIERLRSESA